jgi:ribonuclease D
MEMVLVEDATALTHLCGRIAPSAWVALDTEFTRESTYYAKLGLLQVATDGFVACVDPLAVDIAPLLDVLEGPGILKVIHAARQDLEVLHDLRNKVLHPLFDTQVAAALLGYPSQVGYAALVESIVGVKLPKLQTRTNWERRPLTDAQVQYAADDVSYLRNVYRELDARLQQRDRSVWLVEECAALADPALYRSDPQAAYLRLNPGRNVPAAAQPLLKALAGWRERTAQARNRPRSWIATDADLIEIARAAPRDRAALDGLNKVSAAVLQHHADDILGVVAENSGAAPERIWTESPPTTPAEQVLLRRMQDRIDAIAKAQNITPEVLATRRSVFVLMREHAGPLSRGWRYELVGRDLLAMIEAGA